VNSVSSARIPVNFCSSNAAHRRLLACVPMFSGVVVDFKGCWYRLDVPYVFRFFLHLLATYFPSS
jgi:hypothetical protein